MSLRIEFVERAEKGEKVAALCREFGLSRTTGHKWLKRFKELGHDGLEEESRRPRSTPLATAEDLVMAVLEARDARPRLGPRKLEVVLRRRFGEQTPSARTIARILKRANRVRARRRDRAPNVVHRAPEVQAKHANDVWTVDFKGWWKTLDGERCEPLTVRDAYSRYVLEVFVCRPTTEQVRAVFERLFRKHGVPNAIQCDNGTPFVAVRARGGISQLSAWWLSLAIRLVRSRPGCPQDNGGHERMHADIAGDVQSSPAGTVRAEQRRLSRWRQEFNHVRPHDALGGKVPADLYKVEERRLPVRVDYVYPAHILPRRVYSDGDMCFRSERLYVGQAFSGLDVGIEVVDALHIRAWFRDVDLGLIETIPQVADSCFEEAAPRHRRGPSALAEPIARRKVPRSAGAAAALAEDDRQSRTSTPSRQHAAG
jgi:transposase InsO family protein